MTQSELRDALLLMVREYGYEQVQQKLREIGLSEHDLDHHRTSATGVPREPSRDRATKRTASQYVARMDIVPEKESPVYELARRFDAKSFLPSYGDVVNFCHCYGIDEPASRSRANAIPRIFKSIALLEVAEIQRIGDEGFFSGPSRLEPIADAIRRSSSVTSVGRVDPALPSHPLTETADARYDMGHGETDEEGLAQPRRPSSG